MLSSKIKRSNTKGTAFSSQVALKGFTLIELLVAVMIMGILSSIALPSLFGQMRKARESRAQNVVGAVNRAQQAYRLDNSSFADNIAQLKVNAPVDTEQYTYQLGTVNASLAEYKAAPTNVDLRAFTGCTTASNGGVNATTGTIIMEVAAGVNVPASPPTCP
jgi:type IV pilus assembly protein PilA